MGREACEGFAVMFSEEGADGEVGVPAMEV